MLLLIVCTCWLPPLLVSITYFSREAHVLIATTTTGSDLVSLYVLTSGAMTDMETQLEVLPPFCCYRIPLS